MKKYAYILLAIIILSSGCLGAGETTSSEIEDIEPLPDAEAETSAETGGTELFANSKQLEVSHIYSGATILDDDNTTYYEERALSYIGAFAMLASYDDSSILFSDTIANSGVGAHAILDKRVGLYNGFKERSIIEAADNLGYYIYLGLRDKGLARSRRLEYDFEDSARQKTYFADGNEAMDNLKQVISSGKPVEVHLDAYILESTFAEQSDFWKENKVDTHFSHFFVITGYDTDNIYLLDPNDPEGITLEAPDQDFQTAWEHGARGGMSGAHLGPFWMISIEEGGAKNNIGQVIGWNKLISPDASFAVRSTKQIADFGELGVGRREFAKYLKEHGSESAAEKYAELGEAYLRETITNVDLMRLSGNEQVARARLH
jgi:hypothetical protein|tara:strand:- start:1521 stop:2645 length:1125 start_codon:yes stop_codon:yes gene_type:complete